MKPTGVRISDPGNAVAASDAERSAWAQRAAGMLDRDWILQTLAGAVDVASPTGEERAFAGYLVKVMQDAGLKAWVQPIDALSANAVGELADGNGPSVMLFAPLDTQFSGIEDEEVPWSGPALRPDQLPAARIQDGAVIGLSADNPKGHIVAAIAAVAALKQAGVPLSGRVVLAFGAGGAPSNKRPALARWNVGHGSGCEYLLQQGVRGDFAIITKPGYAVQWEEVGVCWFRVRVHGSQTYVGRKHALVDNNPILRAARVALLLDDWFAEYSRRHTDGLVAPQAAIGAIQGGWTYKPAFPPAACDLYVDMRISPRSSPMQAWRELTDALADIKAKLGDPSLTMDCNLIAAVEGPGTPENSWIVRSCTRAWETVEGRKHEPLTQTSGQTEAAILRRHGIPTARVGLPTHMTPNADRPAHTTGVAKAADILKLAEVLVRTLVDTCTRSLQDVGLAQDGERDAGD